MGIMISKILILNPLFLFFSPYFPFLLSIHAKIFCCLEEVDFPFYLNKKMVLVEFHRDVATSLNENRYRVSPPGVW